MLEYGQPLAQTLNLPATAVEARLATTAIAATRNMTKRTRIFSYSLAYRHRTDRHDSLLFVSNQVAGAAAFFGTANQDRTVPADEPDPELLALEPEDIHLVCLA